MVLVVNIIPSTWSDDVNQDSEPGLSVNPANPNEIVATAFTLDNPAGEPMVGPLAPVFYSNDGGLNWVISKIVPSDVNASWPTGDITIRYGGSSGALYGGYLTPGTDMYVLRSPDVVTPMTKLFYHTGDQPYAQATTVVHGGATGKDRVYVPFNDGAYPGLLFSLDAAATAPPAGFDQNYLNLNGRPGTGGIPVRVAIHPSGAIYGAFYHGSAQSSKVVVVRDNNWGKDSPPFGVLIDPSDMKAGRIVAANFPISAGTVGQQRVAGSMSLAVDPNNSERVYVSYATAVTPASYTLHVASSSDGGASWVLDQRIIPVATNPAIAISTLGHVGFLYQQLVPSGAGFNWVTRFERSTDDFASPPESFTLADTPSDFPADTLSGVYLGDYLHLQAVGKEFYGIFCADNTPDLNHFPSGVNYQRNHHFPSKKLLGNDGHSEIPPSIDPFYFKVEAISSQDDFYVRDWTDSATSHDAGAEPSTNPVFYETSDVWNQWDGSAPMIQADDRPAHQIPLPGDNFAFVRVCRRAAPDPGSPPVTVTAHFLYADFGLGTVYQDISASPLGQIVVTATDSSPNALANGVKWQLPASHSQHICLAVQISTPADPFALAPGGLLGHAPGWPTTDLMVINDNNKAQRNIDFPVMLAERISEATFYVLIHNAATYRRDLSVRCEAPQEVLRSFKSLFVGEAGGRRKRFRSPDMVTFAGMQPGECRWLALTVRGASSETAQSLPFRFLELSGGRVLNGVSITVRPSPLFTVIRDNLQSHLAVMNRLEAMFSDDVAHREGLRARAVLAQAQIPEKAYIAFFDVKIMQELIRIAIDATPQAVRLRFRPNRSLRRLRRYISARNPRAIASAHSALLHTLDALLTTHQMSQGVAADIPLNVRWQADLYSRLGSLRFEGAGTVVSRSRSFMTDYAARRITNQDYPSLIRELLPVFHETASRVARRRRALAASIADMERSLDSPVALQRAHRRFLLGLQG